MRCKERDWSEKHLECAKIEEKKKEHEKIRCKLQWKLEMGSFYHKRGF